MFIFLNIKLYCYITYAFLNFIHPSKNAEIFLSIMLTALKTSAIDNGISYLKPLML